MGKKNELLIDEEAVQNTMDPLTRLVRNLLRQMRVTHELFRRRFDEAASRTMMDPSKRSSACANLMTAMTSSSDMTWKRIREIFTLIINGEIVGIQIRWRPRDLDSPTGFAQNPDGTDIVLTIDTDDPIVSEPLGTNTDTQ